MSPEIEWIITSRRLLIGILQFAYSGELEASYAYQGQGKSVASPEEESRKLMDEMLRESGRTPKLLEGIQGGNHGTNCRIPVSRVRLARTNVRCGKH